MTKHTQSIFIIGVIVPAVLLIALLGGAIYGRNKLHAARDQKLAVWREHVQAMAALQTAQSEFSGREDGISEWKDSMEQELIQTLTANLQKAMAEYSDQQLRQTELSRPGGTSQFASATENHYDRFRLTFEGGFGPMQRVLATLETRMPQLVLEDLSISPAARGGGDDGPAALKFAVTYLSWREE